MSNNFVKISELAKTSEVTNIVDSSVSEVKNWVEDNASDWLAKEGEEGYIKNNPLTRNLSEIGSLKDIQYYYSGNYKRISIGNILCSEAIEIGTQYVVSIDDTQYDCIGIQNPKSFWMQLTNGKINDDTGNPYELLDPHEGEFTISFSGSNYNNGQFYIYDPDNKLDQETLHTIVIYKDLGIVIDSKYVYEDWDNIKNKPFDVTQSLIFIQDNVSISNANGNGYGPLSVSFLNDFKYNTELIYTVIINENVYSDIPSNINGFLSNDYTGNAEPLYKNSNFIIMSANNAPTGSMYFKYPLNNSKVTIYANFVKKLDNKYIEKTSIDRINILGNEYKPYYSNGKNIVRIDGVTQVIKMNSASKSVDNNGTIDLGDIVNSVTINDKRQTTNVNLTSDIQKMIDNELCEDIDIVNGYEFVDMGLSVKWATCNIGATKPEECGWYFQWAGTKAYNQDCTPVEGGNAISFGFNSNCPYWESGTILNIKWSKYTRNDNDSINGVADYKNILDLEDDAAYVHLGENCRIPSTDEFAELINACNVNWVIDYNGTGVNGRLFTLKRDPSKQLFFPAASYIEDKSIKYLGKECYYWKREAYDTFSKYGQTLYMDSGVIANANTETRCMGITIRPILTKVKKYLTKIKAQELYQPKGEYVTTVQLEGYQPKGEYLTEHQDISNLATKEDIGGLSNSLTSVAGSLNSSIDTLRNYAEETYQTKGDYITSEQLSKSTVEAASKIVSNPSIVTDISKVPTTSQICTVNISTDGTFGLDGEMIAGTELQIFINNTGSNDITITIPTDTFKTNGITDISIPVGNYGEINIISDGTNLYLRAI